MVKGTKRAIVIIHPDFDLPGSAGVMEAKNFAENFLKSQKELLEQMRRTQPPGIVQNMERYLKSMRVLVRNLPVEVL